MKKYLPIAAIGAALALSAPAMADSGIPSSYFEGGGCFNFLMNGIQYSLPNVGIGEGQIIPRGGQSTIDGWKNILLLVPKGSVSFTRLDAVDTAVCPKGGFGLKGVSSP